MKAKKLIALLLAVMMIVSAIPALSFSAFAEGEITETTTPTDTTTYTEAADYDALVTALIAKQNVKLTADITFPATAPETAIAELWDGAVINGNGFGFKGVTLTRGMFTVADGAHFTIKNLDIEATLTITSTSYHDNVDRFGVITDIISNVSFDITNVDITVTANMNVTGGLSGIIGAIKPADNSKSTLSGCTVNGTIITTHNTSANYWASAFISGIRASTGTVVFERCVNNATVKGSRHVSGFTGETYSAVTFDGCINKGDIYAYQRYAAGIMSYNATNYTTDTTNKIVLKGCKNYGKIECGSGGYAASMIARFDVTGIDVEITRCSNFGEMTGAAGTVGGIVGHHSAISSNISYDSCLNMGNVSTTGSNVGGLLGLHYTVATDTSCLQITNCAVVANVSGSARRGPIVGNGKDFSDTSTYAIANNLIFGTYKDTGHFPEDNTTAKPESADEAVVLLNSYAMGYFYNDNGTIKLDEDVPQLWGTQTTYKAGDTEMDVRFIAVLRTDKLNNYESVGFTVTPIDNGESGDPVDLNCTTVFTSLLAQGSNSVIERTAGDFGGSYIFALSVTGVPTNASFIVKPYATQKVGGDKLGVSWQLTFDSVEGKYTATPIYE